MIRNEKVSEDPKPVWGDDVRDGNLEPNPTIPNPDRPKTLGGN